MKVAVEARVLAAGADSAAAGLAASIWESAELSFCWY